MKKLALNDFNNKTYKEVSAILNENFEITELKHADLALFFLTEGENLSPSELLIKNVKELETMCKEANALGIRVVLYSPKNFKQPKTAYELSALIAEDLVIKLGDFNEISRTPNGIK